MEYSLISCRSKTTNLPLAHSLPSDIISPNLVPSDSTCMQKDSPHKALKIGIGGKRNLNQNEVVKIVTRGKCPSTQVAFDLHSLSAGESRGHSTTIDILPDGILLEIFVFILSGRTRFIRDCPIWNWHKLVHVCRRWRQLIFASPIHLDLQLLCTRRTPIKKDLGLWPAFPLVIDYHYFRDARLPTLENIFTALEQRDRVRHINISVPGSLFGELFAAMEKPFPALTHLCLLRDNHEDEPIIPGAFLGGSAPLLRDIFFSGILFPGIPTFLSSACDLVNLRLDDILHTSFPSPEAMVTCLATLTKLETIFIRFQAPTTRPDRIRVPPETWAILSSLTSFSFKRNNAYLEDFVARINAPRLNSIDITYTEDDFQVQATELARFIERSNLRPTRSGHTTIYFEFGRTFFLFYHDTNPNDSAITVEIESLEILSEQGVDMTMVLCQAEVLLSDVVHLEIESDCPREIGEDDDTDNIWWLEFFHLFIAVETLRISYQFVEVVAHAFEKMPVEMVTQVLPALKSLHLEGPFTQSATIEGLSSTFRQAFGRPLIITSDDRF